MTALYAATLSISIALAGGVPVYSVDAADITVPGCLAVVGWDPRSDGLQAAALAARVLRGASPATLPFTGSETTSAVAGRRSSKSGGITPTISAEVPATWMVLPTTSSAPP